MGTHAARSHAASPEDNEADGVYAYGMPSDTNSEEIILQKMDPVHMEPGHGIMRTRDVTVKYSDN